MKDLNITKKDFLKWDSEDLITHRRSVLDLMGEQFDENWDNFDDNLFHVRQNVVNCIEAVLRDRGFAV